VQSQHVRLIHSRAVEKREKRDNVERSLFHACFLGSQSKIEKARIVQVYEPDYVHIRVDLSAVWA
jgi:hypothetical protein